MGFLDERPFRAGDPLGRELLHDLMTVYYHPPVVQQFADAAGISRSMIAWTGPMEDVWPELLRKAANLNRLRRLVELVAEHPESGGIEPIKRLLAEPRANGTDPSSDPYGRHLLGGGQVPRPFLDRVPLRELLRQFASPDAERVLVVTGGKRAGKSYSWHLIHHIGRSVGVRPYLVDLARWSGRPASPDEVMMLIVDALAMAEKPQPEYLAQGDAQAMKLYVWFLGQIRRWEEPCWLVLDGMDRAPLTDSARRLIIDIIEAVKNNEAGRLRVALLAGPRPDVDDFQVLHDEIGPVPLDELRVFFDQVSVMTGGGRLTDAAFARLLIELFGESVPPEWLCLEQIGPRAARLASRVFLNGTRRG